MEAFVFFVSAAIILAGALGVIVMRNPVHAALSLVMTLFGVAVLFINLEAYFLAAVQVIVYAGAIVVLFLFVIMLVGVDRAEDLRTEPIIRQRELALLAGAGLLAIAVIVGVASGGDVTGVPAQGDPEAADLAIDRAVEVSGDFDGDGDEETITEAPEPNVRRLGRALFTDYVFAFEITAILLTIAVVGAVVMARRPEGELQPLPEVEPPWVLRPDLDPDPHAEVAPDPGAVEPEPEPDPEPDEAPAAADGEPTT